MSGFVDRGVHRLLEEVDRAVRLGAVNARSPIGDAALDLAQQVGYQLGTADIEGRMTTVELDGLLAADTPDTCWACKAAFDGLPHDERVAFYSHITHDGDGWGAPDFEPMRDAINEALAAGHATHSRSWIA